MVKISPDNVTSLHTIETEIDPITVMSKIAPITVGNPVKASSLAIDQEHLEEFVEPEAKSSVVECRRPPKGHFFCVRPELVKPYKDRAFYYLLEREGYDPLLVDATVGRKKREEGEDTVRLVMLVRFATMVGNEGLWPLKINPTDARANAWNTSALNILRIAEKNWVRIESGKKEYLHRVSNKTFEDTPPQFSDRPFGELVDSAFPEDKTVPTSDHEIWEILRHGSKK